METKKTKLIETLNMVINALKNNTIHYEWTQQESCNCGVVAQAILGKNKVQIRTLWEDALVTMEKTKNTTDKIERTWRDAVKRLCPITGEPMAEIFKRLFENGLSKEDIVHLEYMNNPAIIKRSKINTDIVYNEKKEKKTKNEIATSVPRSFFLWRLLGFKKTIIEYQDVVQNETIKKGYYTQSENLILYLTAWVAILKEGGKYKAESGLENATVNELENELLNAVADEKYEYATELKNELALR